VGEGAFRPFRWAGAFPGLRLPPHCGGDPEAHPLLGAAGYQYLQDPSFRWAHPRAAVRPKVLLFISFASSPALLHIMEKGARACLYSPLYLWRGDRGEANQ
jgi:hypothetical protein